MQVKKLASHIHNPRFRHIIFVISLVHLKQGILAVQSVIIRCRIGGCGCKQNGRAASFASVDCDIRRMIPRRNIGFITVFVLFIKDDYSDIVKRNKHRRPCTDNHADLSVFYPVPLVIPLANRKSAVHNRDRITETADKPFDHLRRERNLRDKHYRLFSQIHTVPYRVQKNLGLTASRYTSEQNFFMLAAVDFLVQILNYRLLFFCRNIIFCVSVFFSVKSPALYPLFINLN